MKKNVLVAVLMLAAVFAVSAAGFDPFGYAAPVSAGKNLVDVGVGYGYGLDVHAAYEMVNPVKAGDLTLPLSYGAGVDVSFQYGLNFSVVGRAAWHMDLGLGMPLDLYFGTAIGFRGYNVPNGWDENYKPTYRLAFGLDVGGYSGVRYFFSNTMAAFGEFGYTGLTYAKAGITMVM